MLFCFFFSLCRFKPAIWESLKHGTCRCFKAQAKSPCFSRRFMSLLSKKKVAKSIDQDTTQYESGKGTNSRGYKYSCNLKRRGHSWIRHGEKICRSRMKTVGLGVCLSSISVATGFSSETRMDRQRQKSCISNVAESHQEVGEAWQSRSAVSFKYWEWCIFCQVDE